MTNALKSPIDHRDTLDWQAQQSQRGEKHSLWSSNNHKLHSLLEKEVKCQTHKPAKHYTFFFLVKSPADHFDVSPNPPDIFNHYQGLILHIEALLGVITKNRCADCTFLHNVWGQSTQKVD